jgi:hypothetical protein
MQRLGLTQCAKHNYYSGHERYWRGYTNAVLAIMADIYPNLLEEQKRDYPRIHWDPFAKCAMSEETIESQFCDMDQLDDTEQIMFCNSDCPEYVSLSEENPMEMR